MAALGAAQPQEAVRQDAAVKKSGELILDEPRLFRSGACLGVGNEAGRVSLRQAGEGRLLGAMAFVVKLGAIPCPPGLLANGLHDGLPMR